jgi:hypothetical protein
MEGKNVLDDERSVAVVETQFLQQLSLFLSQIDGIVTSACLNPARHTASAIKSRLSQKRVVM